MLGSTGSLAKGSFYGVKGEGQRGRGEEMVLPVRRAEKWPRGGQGRFFLYM